MNALHKILSSLLVLSFLLLHGPAMAEPTTLPALTIPDGFGVNIHFTKARPEELKALGESGVRFIRMDFAWGGIERTRGAYDFSAYDGLVADMARLGIRCVLILDYGNRLYDDGLSPHTQEGQAAFARWAGAAAKHFAGKGILWEIWNEPNIGFWKPKPNVDDYCSLCLATIDAVRQGDPNAFIMGPASSTFPWDFFETMGKRGVIARLDAVSVHPYRQTVPEMAEADYARLRMLIERYAPGCDIPIVSGEWGYSTAWKGMDDEKQANYLPRQRLLNLSLGVPVSIWYDWKDDGADPKEPEHHFGSVFRDLKPKPSYITGKALAETLAGYSFVRRVATENPKDYVLLLRSGNRAALAAWTTAEPHSIKLPAPAGDMTVVARDGQRKTVRSADLTLELSASPQYLLLDNSPAADALGAWKPAQSFNLLRATGEVAVPVAVEPLSNRALHGEFRIVVDGQVIGKLPVNIAPGGKRVLSIPMDFVRREQRPILARIIFVPEDKTASEQSAFVWLLAANPLSVSILPPVGQQVMALAENPSGAAAELKLRLTAGTSSAESTLTLAAGQEQASVAFALPAEPSANAELRLEAFDAANHLILATPAIRWVPTAMLVADAPWRASIEGDAKLKATAEASIKPLPAPPQPGLDRTLGVNYQLPNGWKYIALMPPDRTRAIEGKPQTLGMWLDGDSSGNFVRCRLNDSTGQTFQPAYGPITWTGWKWITMPLADPHAGHWGGANDGVIHYPIRWDAPLLIDNGKLKVGQPLTIQAAGFALGY